MEVGFLEKIIRLRIGGERFFYLIQIAEKSRKECFFFFFVVAVGFPLSFSILSWQLNNLLTTLNKGLISMNSKMNC